MTTEVPRLLAEAAEWRLLGLLFEYPSESWRAQLTVLAADLVNPELQEMARAALEFATPGLHIALFGPAGSVPAREVTYFGGVQFGYLMAELAAFYNAFGYRPATPEADDHISVEAGFLSYLKVKQAYALASGQPEQAAIASEAAANFLKAHLALLAEPLAASLQTFAPDYLIHAGQLLFHHAGPSPRSDYPLGSVTETEDDSAVFSCGPAASGLVQLEKNLQIPE